jgi:hypothetical protein
MSKAYRLLIRRNRRACSKPRPVHGFGFRPSSRAAIRAKSGPPMSGRRLQSSCSARTARLPDRRGMLFRQKSRRGAALRPAPASYKAIAASDRPEASKERYNHAVTTAGGRHGIDRRTNPDHAGSPRCGHTLTALPATRDMFSLVPPPIAKLAADSDVWSLPFYTRRDDAGSPEAKGRQSTFL